MHPCLCLVVHFSVCVFRNQRQGEGRNKKEKKGTEKIQNENRTN
jgi:hypothetical protein